MTINDQIRDEKLQYNIDREGAKISALSQGGGTNSEKISVQLFLDNFITLIPKMLVIFYKNDF